MSSLNRCEFIGNLGKDPETRFTNDGTAVTGFSIACSESWKDKNSGEKVERTEWINVSAFGKLAEIMEKYLSKGSKVFIAGKMKTDKYEKDGKTLYSTKIVANEMIMLDSKNETAVKQGEAVSREKVAQHSANQGTTAASQGVQAINNDFDDEIPF